MSKTEEERLDELVDSLLYFKGFTLEEIAQMKKEEMEEEDEDV